MNLETTLRGRPRNTWQNEVRKIGRIVGGEGLQKKLYNTDEWKKLLRTARSCCILHVNEMFIYKFDPFKSSYRSSK
jgi:hypothetical protein